MTSYSDIQTHCEECSKLSRAVIDEFLIYYAAEKEKIVPQIDFQLKRYKKAAHEIQVSYINFLKSEYIAHRIFKKEGFIDKYLTRPEIKKLPQEQYRYLEFQSQHPWRFSFAEVRHKPAAAFFEMEDIMTGEQYLLYSPGMQATKEDQHPRLWFNLIAFNGKCWQTFGLIIPFKSFTVDDLFFFATELNPLIEDGETLMQEVENNSFPFFMLLSASDIPVMVSRGHATVICQATDVVENFSTENLSAYFVTAWNKDVYRLTSKKSGEFPHLAIAYYDEQEKMLTRTAMTEAGFDGLTEELAKAGFDLNAEADIVVSLGMLSAAGNILDKKIELNPYEKLFEKYKDEAKSENLKRINHFLQLALPFYNAGKEPDIKQFAREAGIEEETAASVWEQVKKNADKARSKKRP